ncbi:MAG: hypothetical protein U1E46_08460 [Hyphomicrobiales bacterium]
MPNETEPAFETYARLFSPAEAPLAGARMFAYTGAAAAAVYGAWYGFLKGALEASNGGKWSLPEVTPQAFPWAPRAMWSQGPGFDAFALKMPGFDFGVMGAAAPAVPSAATAPFASVREAMEEAIGQTKGLATFTASALGDAVEKSRDVADFARDSMKKAFEEGQEITRRAVETGIDVAGETRKVLDEQQDAAMKVVEQGIDVVSKARKAFEEGQEMTRRAAERSIETAVETQRSLAQSAAEVQKAMAGAVVGAGATATAIVANAVRNIDASLDSPNRPPFLASPRGEKDNLKFISGIGPKIERTLNDLGIFHYDQIAQWTDAQVDWVNAYLKFPGRMMRDSWVEQAKSLVRPN